MKVKVTFEMDLADTHYNIDEVRLIPVCLQNLSSWFNKLHLHYLEESCNSVASEYANEETKKAVCEHVEQDLKLSEQLFNNWKVEGATDDGHKFEFVHQEPGYKEKTLVDGVETYIEPYEGD